MAVSAGVDCDRDCLTSYQTNFPEALSIQGNVSEAETIKKCAALVRKHSQKTTRYILVSGPPCQGFSDAGPRQIADPRNEIMISVAKAIVCLRPKAALVENVSALRKERNLQLLNRFRSVLNRAGYHVYRYELNALDFGLAQNRRRMIFFVLPFPVSRVTIPQALMVFHQEPRTVSAVIGDLPAPPVRPKDHQEIENNGTLANHYAMRHSDRVRKKIAGIEQGKGPLSYRKLTPDSHAPTLLSGHRAAPVHYEQARSITAREALRLQGFPDHFRVMGPFANQMTQVTNAVPAPLGIAALKVLLHLLGETQ